MPSFTILAKTHHMGDFKAPMPVSALLSAHQTPVDEPCGGRGTCGKCRVWIRGNVSEPTAAERAALSADDLARGIRLACQTVAHGDVEIRLDAVGEGAVLTSGDMPPFVFAPWGGGLGFAVDIGTTTVAAYLYDLRTGARLAVASAQNPQGAFGADVISRLEKALEGRQAALRDAIVRCIARLAADVCAQAGQDVSAIGAAVLAGNTAMMYLLCEKDPTSITRVPFTLDEPFGISVRGDAVGLPETMNVYLPRCISAYVGADITMALRAAELYADGKVYEGPPALLVDIGTNGEMVLCAGGQLLTCSTAAGPAFEGAGIHQGMTAREGAIVHVTRESGKIRCEVLGDTEATGICGSGLVDAVAVLLDCGILDETGLIDEENEAYAECLTEWDDQPAFRLPGTQVLLTQADIRAVQLAKSAIHAGMLALLDAAGLRPEAVKRLLIAGGFGSSIDPASAERIGLIPEGYAALARPIGNAAGVGASMTLLSQSVRADGEAAAQGCETVELATNPTFMAQFVEQMMFP